jgi:hypothetical protein
MVLLCHSKGAVNVTQRDYDGLLKIVAFILTFVSDNAIRKNPACARRQPVTPTDGAAAVPAGEGSSPSLPGDPGIDPAGIMTGARGASLKRDVQGEGNACAQHRVKRGLD